MGNGAPFGRVASVPVRESIGRFKYVEEAGVDEAYEKIMDHMKKEIAALVSKEDEDDD